ALLSRSVGALARADAASTPYRADTRGRRSGPGRRHRRSLGPEAAANGGGFIASASFWVTRALLANSFARGDPGSASSWRSAPCPLIDERAVSVRSTPTR